MKPGFYLKWLCSTKFQVCILALAMMAALVIRYELAPEVAAAKITELSLGYFAARVVEPIVEFAVGKLDRRGVGLAPDGGMS